MKKTIRLGVFETNSSTTHRLVIGTKEQFDKWANGELILDGWQDKFITLEQARAKIGIDGDLDEEESRKMHYIFTYDDFGTEYGEYMLEHDGGTFETPSGDVVQWEAAFGYDY